MTKTRFKIEKRRTHPDCPEVGWCRPHPQSCHCEEWVLTYKGEDMVGRMNEKEATKLLAAIKEDRKLPKCKRKG